MKHVASLEQEFTDISVPTAITHAVTAIAAGSIATGRRMSARFWILSVVSSILADMDVLAFAFGIPYDHTFGHRGFFHSLCFAFLWALFVVAICFRNDSLGVKGRLMLCAYFALLTSSHGILDMATDGGLGIALFSPFDKIRYLFPVRPFVAAPLTPSGFLSSWGLLVLLNEALGAWIPLLVLIYYFRTRVKPTFFPRT